MIKCKYPIIFVCSFLAILLYGCGRSLPEEGERADQPLMIFAAASLTDVMQEIVQEFEKTTGEHVYLNFAGTNTLRLQIEKGSPAQVLISADEYNVRTLIDKGFVRPEFHSPFAGNRLVVICPRGRPFTLNRFEDLPLVISSHLSLADPDTVPAGIYAKEAMHNAGGWEKLQRYIAPAVDVRAALAQVEMANADGGIVYHTDAVLSKRVNIVLDVPQKFHRPIYYYKCLLGSHPCALADSFYRFLDSEIAKSILEKYGFILL
ncbi:MAG: molybdate ABC transporter substrate-binding protein [Candidatus Omnitrophota bacterium]|jgi:molybdate transport system substrate-binding protein